MITHFLLVLNVSTYISTSQSYKSIIFRYTQARYFEKDIESGVCWLGLNGEKKMILNESYRFNLILFHELLEVIIMSSSRY